MGDDSKKIDGLTWIDRLGPVENTQLLAVTGRGAQERILPAHGYWDAPSAWIDRSQGMARAAEIVQDLAERAADLPADSWSAGYSTVRALLTLQGRLAGLSETGIAVRAPVYAPKPVPGFTCTSKLFPKIGIEMPVANLAESEFPFEAEPGIPMPEILHRFQVIGWTEEERNRIRKWMTKNRLKVVG